MPNDIPRNTPTHGAECLNLPIIITSSSNNADSVLPDSLKAATSFVTDSMPVFFSVLISLARRTVLFATASEGAMLYIKNAPATAKTGTSRKYSLKRFLDCSGSSRFCSKSEGSIASYGQASSQSRQLVHSAGVIVRCFPANLEKSVGT